MTARIVEVRISCDSGGSCRAAEKAPAPRGTGQVAWVGAWTVRRAPSIAAARRDARAAGWSTARDVGVTLDWCPACTAGRGLGR